MMYGERFTLRVSVQQCGVICSDGVELMGLATAATYGEAVPVTVLFIPGQFDNAYQQRKNHFLLAEAFNSETGCVIANSRGQDYYGYQRKYESTSNLDAYTWVLLGSSFERVDDAWRDLDAWIAFIRDIAPDTRIALVGHSHGAIKVANYMLSDSGKAIGDRIASVVLLSPSDDIGGQTARLGDRYGEALTVAQGHIEDGQPNAIMPEWAESAPMSAGTYFEAFGPHSPLRTFAFHSPKKSPLAAANSGWIQPTLVLFGSNDIATGPMSSVEACTVATRLLVSSKTVETTIVEGANHHYRGFEAEVARRIITWVNAVTPR